MNLVWIIPPSKKLLMLTKDAWILGEESIREKRSVSSKLPEGVVIATLTCTPRSAASRIAAKMLINNDSTLPL